MRAMMTTARMTAAASAVEGFSCADVSLLPDAITASVFVILAVLGLRGFLLALAALLSIILRRYAAVPKDAPPRFA